MTKELKDVIVHGTSRLDMTLTVSTELFQLLTLAWAIACVAIVQHSCAEPFPFLLVLKATTPFAVGLSIPLTSQFLLPATQVVVYLWTLYWFQSISLPFHLTVFSFPLLSCLLWLFGPKFSLGRFSRLTGYANLMVAITFLTLNATWILKPPSLTYDGVFIGLNTGLQLIFINCFFPEHAAKGASFAVASVLLGGLQDPAGFVVGIITSAASFACFVDDGENHQEVTPPSVPLSSQHTPEVDKEPGTHPEIPHDSPTTPPEIIPPPPFPSEAELVGLLTTVHAEPDEISSRPPTPSSSPSIPTAATVPAPVPLSESPSVLLPSHGGVESLATTIQPANLVAQPGRSATAGGGHDGGDGDGEWRSVSPETLEPVRRRHSVLGPRERTRTLARPTSLRIDASFGRTPSRPLPNPPLRGSTLPASTTRATSAGTRHAHSSSVAAATATASLLSSAEVQARWSDDLFEILERLGESSSRVAYKVRERRSGLVFVKKTFYPRQKTSGNHIVLELLSLINRQDGRDAASSHLVRCYGAYLPSPNVVRGLAGDEREAGGGVRAIFEYCEGGSLQAIGSSIARRGGIVGEKVVGRIATGMLRGLGYLHGLNMVHLNIRPSNVFITQFGIVKLSEPEIPGEGAVALTERFIKAVYYASPERIRGNPTNLLKSDVWALGISLLEFVQNRYPYPPDLSTVELMMRIVNGDPPQLQGDENVTWSLRMKSFFTQCLLVNESQRPSAQILLSSPWILSIGQQNVRMDRWIREVWA